MEENLLTILTSRWGQRQTVTQADQSPGRDELSGSDRAEAIALVSSPVGSWGEALTQASLLRGRLNFNGWFSELVVRAESSTTSPFSIFRSIQKYISQLSELMTNRTVAHIIIDRPIEVWLTALPAIIVARFYGLPTVLYLLGDWPTKINPVISRFMKPVLGLTAQIWVSTGVASKAKDSLRNELHEVGPLIDLESNQETPDRTTIQPALLIDARDLDQVAIRELIAGCRLAKDKYPRTECTLLIDSPVAASIEAGLENGGGHGVTLRTDLKPDQLKLVFNQADIFLTGSKAQMIDSFLLQAAAHGLPIMVGQNSALTAMLKDKHQFSPLEFRNRSDLADLIIKLVEEPDSIENHSWRSKALAEQFAWDNVIATIQSHFSSVSRKSPTKN